MKKIFTLCLALMALASMPAMAQDDDEDEIDPTLEFVDAQGNLVPDGSELTVNTPEYDDFGVLQVHSGLYVRNTSDEDVFTAMEVNLSRLDNGTFNCCFPMNCSAILETGIKTTNPGQVNANEQKHSLETEWIPDADTSYGEAVAKLRICMYAKKVGIIPTAGEFTGYGPAVTVTFVNPDPTGISSVNATSSINKVTAVYNLRGEQLPTLQKGLNIVRYADGTTKKVIK